MSNEKEKFILDEIFSLTLMATVQRAKVYTPNSSDQSRRQFQKTLRFELEKIANSYKRKVDEKTHINNIRGLSVIINSHHKDILNHGNFRIGVAQKALNLYLKYLWCLGRIPRPPHCPFDYRIISILKNYNGPNWTVLDSLEDYIDLVEAAKTDAEGSQLSEWELRKYNKSNR